VAAAAVVKWDAVHLGYVGPACAAGPSSWKDSEEARCREEQRWLREEQQWLRQESRWRAEREALTIEVAALRLHFRMLEGSRKPSAKCYVSHLLPESECFVGARVCSMIRLTEPTCVTIRGDLQEAVSPSKETYRRLLAEKLLNNRT